MRNINWELNSFEFDNLFNYGEGNKINFENLAGIVGIFGKNYSGKSSIIDAALYTLFNSTSKNERKNLNVINKTGREALAGSIILVIVSSLFNEKAKNTFGNSKERKLKKQRQM